MEFYELIIPLLGTVKLVFTDNQHVHVSGPVTLRGVQYNVSVHLFPWAGQGGVWHVGRQEENTYQQRQHLYLTRIDDYSKSASESARTKIGFEVALEVSNFVVNNPAILRDAQANHLHDQMRRAEEKHREAVAAMLETKKAQEAAQDAYEKFQLDGDSTR